MKAYEEAREAHEEAGTTGTPSYADVASNLGDSLRASGKCQEALELFEMAQKATRKCRTCDILDYDTIYYILTIYYTIYTIYYIRYNILY